MSYQTIVDTPVDTNAIELSIVMPCLNEARTVGKCVRTALNALAALGVKGEVIVADNGSTDHSPALANEQGARVVSVPARGYGNAMQAGIAAARGTFIIMGDSDLSCDFRGIAPFLERLRAGDDLVVGNRFKGGIRPGAMPWLHRYVGNPVLTGILNLFFRTPIGDAHCGFRGFRKDACLRLGLTSPGMEFASEMIVKAALHCQRMSEVPVVLFPDGRDRPPHLRSFPDGWRHLRFLLLICPVWLYMIPAVSLLAAGVVMAAFSGSISSALLIVVGYQVAWMWACATTQVCNANLLPRAGATFGLIDSLSLERGLCASAVMMLAGVGMFLMLPESDSMWSGVFILLGVQTIFGSALLNQLRDRPVQKC